MAPAAPLSDRRATRRPDRRVALRQLPTIGSVRAIMAGSLLGALILTGCQGTRSSTLPTAETQAAATQPAARKSGVRTEQELGPVQVTVTVAPAPARLSDEPKLTVTVTAEAGVDVQLPPFGEAVGDFVVLDFREPLVEVRGDREVIRQIYTLEPPYTGTLDIDPIAVTFNDRRPGQDAVTQTVETEALAVEVVSLVDAEAPSLDELQGFAPPVELPRSMPTWPWMVLAVLLPVALVVAAFWFRRRRSRQLSAPELSPREVASRELHRIWQQQLHLHDVKQFYSELTGIVRRYIEGTAGVHAPEQTTEEFLREISAGHVFSADERQRLQDFLESSDLVKFAAHQPEPEDVDEAYQRAKIFVGIDRQPGAPSTDTPDQPPNDQPPHDQGPPNQPLPNQQPNGRQAVSHE